MDLGKRDNAPKPKHQIPNKHQLTNDQNEEKAQ
jgi:hypothetical protein